MRFRGAWLRFSQRWRQIRNYTRSFTLIVAIIGAYPLESGVHLAESGGRHE